MSAPTDSDGWSEWPAPAKLNLGLRIVGRRADGYHLLQTVFQLLDWGDSVRLRVREDGEIHRVAGNEGTPEPDDLMVRAARSLQQTSGCALGCDIAIDKRVPLGGGFGGGSSDAATVLVALDRQWGTRLGEDRLAVLGLQLGADVPVFVRGRNAFAESVGEVLTPVELPPRWYLLVDPGVHVATAALFSDPELTRDATPTTIRAALPEPWDNAFEPILRRREPAIAAALDALSVFGKASVTGSGGGCFVAFDKWEDAEAARLALAGYLPSEGIRKAWVAAGVSRSPLLEQIERLP